jgi:hypothetical protein
MGLQFGSFIGEPVKDCALMCCTLEALIPIFGEYKWLRK